MSIDPWIGRGFRFPESGSEKTLWICFARFEDHPTALRLAPALPTDALPVTRPEQGCRGQMVRITDPAGNNYQLIGGIEIGVEESDLNDRDRAYPVGHFQFAGDLGTLAKEVQAELVERLTWTAWQIERALDEGVSEADEPRIEDCQISEIHPKERRATFHWTADRQRCYEFRPLSDGTDAWVLAQAYRAPDAWAGDREVPLWIGDQRCRFDSNGFATLPLPVAQNIGRHFDLPFPTKRTWLGRLRWQPARFALAAAAESKIKIGRMKGRTGVFPLSGGRVEMGCVCNPEDNRLQLMLESTDPALFGARYQILVYDQTDPEATHPIAEGEVVLHPSDSDPGVAVGAWHQFLPMEGFAGWFDIAEDGQRILFQRARDEGAE